MCGIKASTYRLIRPVTPHHFGLITKISTLKFDVKYCRCQINIISKETSKCTEIHKKYNSVVTRHFQITYKS